VSSSEHPASDLLDGVSPPVPRAIGAVLDSELAALTPVRTRRPVRDALFIVVTGLVVVGVMLSVMRVRKDILELPLVWLVVMGIAWLLGFIVPAWLAVVPPAGQMIARWRAAAGAGAVSAVLFIVSGLMIQPSGPSSSVGLRGPPHFHGCLEIGLIAALVPVLLASIAVRGAFPVGSRWAAAALGAAAGALGGLMLHFHCPIADGVHVSVMHGGVVVVAAGISALIVPRATDAPYR
jgi:Negative regulator of sigma F